MSIKVINDVFDNSDMRGNDRLVMIAIADNADTEKRQGWPSVKEISRKTRIPVRTVWRCIKRCVDRGELRIIKSGGHEGESNLYEILTPRSSHQPTDKVTGVPPSGMGGMPVHGIGGMPPSGTLTVIEPSVQPSLALAKFVRPSLPEMVTYGREINLPTSECERCWNYYESKGWMVGRSPMKDWKAALRNWLKGYLERGSINPTYQQGSQAVQREIDEFLGRRR